jgi:N-acyl-D-amino-acid deacylase
LENRLSNKQAEEIMAENYDLVIRGGLLVDGSGAAPRMADVAISNGMIAGVGEITGKGQEELDATGLIVTPGFVDLHTHYDGQAIWSSRINPSSSHGVTTVIMGNCGVGFAPCRKQDQDLLCLTMEGVEDIPGVVMREGLAWDWSSFPEYLDALEARPHDIDIGVFVPHSPVRVFVMGDRGANREPATDDDLAKMAEIITEGVRAGALGFATTRLPIDRRADGEMVPSFNAAEREVVAAAKAVQAGGGGLVQMLLENGMTGLSAAEEVQLMVKVSHESALPITFSMMPHNDGAEVPRWRETMALIAEHNATAAAKIHAQYASRPIGVLASFDLTSNPFVHCPTYKSIAHLPLPERVEMLRKPEIRNAIVNEQPDDALLPLTTLARMFPIIYPLSDPPVYEPVPGTSVVDIATKQGRTPEEVAYDLLLEDDGKATLFVAAGNFAAPTLDYLFTFFDDPNSVMGLGDGGAHYGLICDSSFPTFVLAHWTRDRAGRRLPLEQAVRELTSVPAAVIGLHDRGVIEVGRKADLNVIDLANLTLHAPCIVDDLPGGGRRLDQFASGYRWTIVSGEIIACNDKPTGNLPGRLIRGAKRRPEMTAGKGSAAVGAL